MSTQAKALHKRLSEELDQVDKDIQGVEESATEMEEEVALLRSLRPLVKRKLLLEKDLEGKLGMLTEKECIAQPLHKLPERETPRGSKNKTRAAHPRTVGKLLPWKEFLPGAQCLYNELDEEVRCFQPKVIYNEKVLDDGTRQHGQAVACEEDVKFMLTYQALLCVTEVAKARGIDFEYIGSGSGRQLSDTDVVIRKCGVTEPEQLSKLIMGSMQIEGSWQLRLGPDDDLIEALDHPDKTAWVEGILQKAYGDAVADEAPLIIITNYEVTYFLLRDTSDVTNKTLKVSPPVPWNCQKPSTMACYLYALQLAAKLWDDKVKRELHRDKVPATPTPGHFVKSGLTTMVFNSKGYKHGVSIQGPQHALASWQRQQPQEYSQQHLQQQQQQELAESFGSIERSSSDGGSSIKRASSIDTDCRSIERGIDRSSSDGCSSSSNRSSSDGGSSSSDGGSHTRSVATSSNSSMSSVWDGWQAWAVMAEQPGLAAAVAAVEALPFLMSSEMTYTDECISYSSTSTVVKGYIAGDPVAVKMYSAESDTMLLFLTEAAAYVRMADLQGICIPPVAAIGRLPHSGTCALGLKLGQPLPCPLPDALANSAKAALAELHNAGYSHNDIHRDNLLVFEDRVLICDLETCEFNPEQHDLDEDTRQLQKVLWGLQDVAAEQEQQQPQ